MPQPISRRRVREFQQAFASEIDSLAALYRNAAAEMMDVLTDAAALSGQRARAAALLHQYQVILADLDDEAAAWIELNIPRAYGAGLEFVDGCLNDIRRAGVNLREITGRVSARPESAIFAQVHREAARAITEAMLGTMENAALQIGRRVDDVFRREGMLAVARGTAEGRTRAEASRALEKRLLELGRPDFVDRLGRHWPLDRYAEMVARTTTREAMTRGTIQRLREHGIELAQVSRHACADFCTFYEDAIVSIGDEAHPAYPPISAIDGGPPFHPRCLPPGERVLTRRGLVPISEVRVGDEVLTHRGRYRPVTAVHRRLYAGLLVTVRADGARLSLTPEHPVLTNQGWVPAGHIGCHLCLARGDEGADLVDYARRVPQESLVADPDDLPAILGQEGIPLPVSRAAIPVPVVLAVELYVQQDRGEGEVQSVHAPGHLEAPALGQACLGQQPGQEGLRLGRAPSAAQRLGASSCHLGRIGQPRVGRSHTRRVAGVELGGLFRQALALMAGRPSLYSEPPHGIQYGVYAPVGQFAHQILQRAALCFIAPADVGLQGLADTLLHPLHRAAAVELAATAEAARATRLPVDRTGDVVGTTTDGTLNLHALSVGASARQHKPVSLVRSRSERPYQGEVYNLEVAEDRSYVAEGLVVHNCVHVLTPFVGQLATLEEKKAGMIPSEVLHQTPAELQRRYREEHPRTAAGSREKAGAKTG